MIIPSIKAIANPKPNENPQAAAPDAVTRQIPGFRSNSK
jgi:hypothetical protein